jgi:hypothetical protein
MLPWFSRMFSSSERGLSEGFSEDGEQCAMEVTCDTTIWRLQTVSGDNSSLLLNSALEMAIAFSRMDVMISTRH